MDALPPAARGWWWRWFMIAAGGLRCVRTASDLWWAVRRARAYWLAHKPDVPSFDTLREWWDGWGGTGGAFDLFATT
jgi:hypothetical protein